MDVGLLAAGEPVPGKRHTAVRALTDNDKTVNTELSAILAAVARCIAQLNNWRILDGRCRAPLPKYISVVALHFYAFKLTLGNRVTAVRPLVDRLVLINLVSSSRGHAVAFDSQYDNLVTTA